MVSAAFSHRSDWLSSSTQTYSAFASKRNAKVRDLISEGSPDLVHHFWCAVRCHWIRNQGDSTRSWPPLVSIWGRKQAKCLVWEGTARCPWLWRGWLHCAFYPSRSFYEINSVVRLFPWLSQIFDFTQYLCQSMATKGAREIKPLTGNDIWRYS